MLERVQSELRKLGVNLSKERTSEWSNVLSKRLTEESTDEEITSLVNEFSSIIKTQAQNDDKVRSLEAKLRQPPTPEVKEEPKDDETPEWAKALQMEIQSLKVEKIQETLKEKFVNDESLKGISKTLLDRLAPKTAEDYEKAVEDARNIAIEINKSSLGDLTPPNGDAGSDVKPATKEEIKDLAKSLLN